jgi:hypothetical protein
VVRLGHAFRRGLARELHRLGVSDKVIQQILRHANVPTTINIYVKMVTQGRIRTDLPSTVQGGFISSKELSGTVGKGGRDLKVATTNGGIELKKS